LFTRLAEHFKVLVAEIEKAMAAGGAAVMGEPMWTFFR
jgi:hypothetical protein